MDMSGLRTNLFSKMEEEHITQTGKLINEVIENTRIAIYNFSKLKNAPLAKSFNAKIYVNPANGKFLKYPSEQGKIINIEFYIPEEKAHVYSARGLSPRARNNIELTISTFFDHADF